MHIKQQNFNNAGTHCDDTNWNNFSRTKFPSYYIFYIKNIFQILYSYAFVYTNNKFFSSSLQDKDIFDLIKF